MRRISSFFVTVFERGVPDPFVLAIVLSIVTAVLAAVFAPHRGLSDIAGAWYKGIFDIFAFALQMILILVTGYALASSPLVARALDGLAARARTPRAAVLVTFFTSAIACFLNWGFGLVVAGLLARAIARRVRLDFGWLVAAAYAGFVVWASGFSSSIALAQATSGNKLNIVEQITGHVLPLSATLFTAFNLVPVAVMFVVVPLLFLAFEPRGDEVQPFDTAQGDTGRPARGDGGRPFDGAQGDTKPLAHGDAGGWRGFWIRLGGCRGFWLLRVVCIWFRVGCVAGFRLISTR